MLSCVQLYANLWTIAHQAPLSTEFSRQEYWSGCHCLLQGIFPTQRSNPGLLHCRQILYRLSHQEAPSWHSITDSNSLQMGIGGLELGERKWRGG